MSSASIFSQRDYALYRNHVTWFLQMRSPLTGRYVEVHVEAVLTLVGEHGQQALELANARARMDEQRVLARGGRWRRLRTRRPQRVRQPRVSPLRRGHRRHVSGRQGTFVTNLSGRICVHISAKYTRLISYLAKTNANMPPQKMISGNPKGSH